MKVPLSEIAEAHRQLPFLRIVGARVTSPKNIRYNCVAHSLNVKNVWYWPESGQPKPGFNSTGRPGHTWPAGDQDATLENFLAFYATFGFFECHDGQLDPKVTKIALYVYVSRRRGDLWVAHAARQLPNGKWASKLGDDVDIVHVKPEDIFPQYKGCSLRFVAKARRLPAKRSTR